VEDVSCIVSIGSGTKPPLNIEFPSISSILWHIMSSLKRQINQKLDQYPGNIQSAMQFADDREIPFFGFNSTF